MGGGCYVGDYNQQSEQALQAESAKNAFISSVEKAENELYKSAVTMSYKTKNDIETLIRLFPDIKLDKQNIIRLNREIEKASYKSLSTYVSIRIDESNDVSRQYTWCDRLFEKKEETIDKCRDIWNTYYAEIKNHIRQKLSRLLDEQTYYFRCAIMEEIKRMENEVSLIKADTQSISLFYDPQYWDSLYLYDICQIAASECERYFLPGGYYV